MKILILSSMFEEIISGLEEILKEDEITDISFHSLDDLDIAQADLILMDYSLSEYEEIFYKVLEHKQKVVVLMSLENFDEVNKIFYETGVNHLFGLTESSSLEDLKKFILSWKSKKKLQFEELAPDPLKVTAVKIVTSQDLQGQIRDLLQGHDFSDCFEGLEGYISQILDESLTNALFNAPVDEQGNYLYRKKNRAEIVSMIPGKEIEVKVASDQDKFVLSVKDFYGTLTENNLFDYLPQGQTRIRDGMGLGMYLIFRYAHKFIINIERNKTTENLIIIDKDKRFKIYDLKERSFHFFKE